MYLPAFYANQFIFGTISFEGYLIPDNEKEIYDIASYWDSINDAVHTVSDEGIILGAYFTEELKLLRLWPINIIPHAHCIFHVDTNGDMNIDHLREKVAWLIVNSAEERGFIRASYPATPSIALSPLEEERYYANALQYGTKAIDLGDAYKEASTRDAGCLFFDGLNRELQWFLNGYLGAIANRVMIHRLGTMHPASKGFVGKQWSSQRKQEFVGGYFDEQKREREDSAG